MTILSGRTIRNLNIISPCLERGFYDTLSFGLGLASYDVRVEFERDTEIATIPAGGFLLASTVERFDLPNNVAGVVHDKSSLVRNGLCVQNTFLEPGWKGYLTLELTNHRKAMDYILHRGMPIAQVVFHFIDQETEGYTGKYQNQERGPQRAR